MDRVLFKSGIQIGGRGPSIYDLRQTAKSDPQAYLERVTKLVDSGKITLPMLGDLRSVYQALADVQVPVTMQVAGATRAVMASAFPILTGTTIIKQINEAYAGVPTVGEKLVTEIDDNKKITTIAAIHALDKDIGEVKESEDFPEIPATEEKIEIRNKRNGRKLSITQEMIDGNELADIVPRVNALGEIAAARATSS